MKPSFFFLHDDTRLLAQLKKGDEGALTEIYTRCRRMVESFVLAHHGTEDDADDVLQESVIVLWERVRKGNYEHRAKISTFIFAVAKHVWSQRLRKLHRQESLTFDLPDLETGTVIDEMEYSEKESQIAQSLDAIGEPCRSILLLFYWEERSMEEIAEILHFANADTVKAKKYQCKKLLEKLLVSANE